MCQCKNNCIICDRPYIFKNILFVITKRKMNFIYIIIIKSKFSCFRKMVVRATTGTRATGLRSLPQTKTMVMICASICILPHNCMLISRICALLILPKRIYSYSRFLKKIGTWYKQSFINYVMQILWLLFVPPLTFTDFPTQVISFLLLIS